MGIQFYVNRAPIYVRNDPQGTKALMYYSQIWKNNKLYNAEVLYEKTTNTIMHLSILKMLQDLFKDAAGLEIVYAYDANGNQTKDLNKGISGIEYNILNLPKRITFSGVNNPVNEYVYSAGGKKLAVIHKSSIEKRTDYVGNMIYEIGSLKRILVDGGYIENEIYHFYLQDHLGNNRVVAKFDGTVVQTNHYYPYGMSFAEGTFADKQPYKYNGKELDTENGLNLYDYDARQMDVISGRFTCVDLMAEKYYNWSPYNYCMGNPLKYIDLRGDSVSIAELYAKDKQGKLINPNQVKASEFLVNTKEGKALLANFAMKGQTLAGVTFNKNGKFHNKGINIAFGTDVRDAGVSGSTNFSLNDENLNIRIVVGNSLDNADQLDTFIHEIVIHADQNSADFIDDKVMNNSNVYPALRKMNESRGYKQHWQERNVNKAMIRIGLPIMQQYYTSQGIVKSNSSILKLMYGFRN